MPAMTSRYLWGDGLSLQTRCMVVVEFSSPATCRPESERRGLHAVRLSRGHLPLQTRSEELVMGPGSVPGSFGQTLDSLPQHEEPSRPGSGTPARLVTDPRDVRLRGDPPCRQLTSSLTSASTRPSARRVGADRSDLDFLTGDCVGDGTEQIPASLAQVLGGDDVSEVGDRLVLDPGPRVVGDDRPVTGHAHRSRSACALIRRPTTAGE